MIAVNNIQNERNINDINKSWSKDQEMDTPFTWDSWNDNK